jgi:predicted RNase H-like HicB family nuclease
MTPLLPPKARGDERADSFPSSCARIDGTPARGPIPLSAPGLVDWHHGFSIQVYPELEDSSWTAEVPEMPGCIAGGLTMVEAVVQVADAIEAWTEAQE